MMKLIDTEGNEVQEAYSFIWAGGSNFTGFTMRVWIEDGELKGEWNNVDWWGKDATEFYKMWIPGAVERYVAESLVYLKEKCESLDLYKTHTYENDEVVKLCLE